MEDKVFRIPKQEQILAYDFNATNESTDIYQELIKIDEEIEECRLRNL